MAKIRKETKKSSFQEVDRFSLNYRPHKTKVITTAFQNNGKGTHENSSAEKSEQGNSTQANKTQTNNRKENETRKPYLNRIPTFNRFLIRGRVISKTNEAFIRMNSRWKKKVHTTGYERQHDKTVVTQKPLVGVELIRATSHLPGILLLGFLQY